MKRKVIIISAWFVLSLILLIHNIHYLSVDLSKKEAAVLAQSMTKFNSHVILDARPKGSGQVLGSTITAEDGRNLLLHKFLAGSPLEKYTDIFIKYSDKLGIDYRLVPSIAMCESNLGRRIPSLDSHNAWGIAVYTGQQDGAVFPGWEKAIEWVHQFINDRFISRNIVDIREIGSIWAPPSVDTGHSWAHCVETFMRSIY